MSLPSFRLDINREVDLIEEVIRLYGLNNIPDVPLKAVSGGVEEKEVAVVWKLLTTWGLHAVVGMETAGGDVWSGRGDKRWCAYEVAEDAMDKW